MWIHAKEIKCLMKQSISGFLQVFNRHKRMLYKAYKTLHILFLTIISFNCLFQSAHQSTVHSMQWLYNVHCSPSISRSVHTSVLHRISNRNLRIQPINFILTWNFVIYECIITPKFPLYIFLNFTLFVCEKEKIEPSN